MDKVVTDVEFLKVPCEKVETVAEGEEISRKLFKRLTEGQDGIGLSANQLGIQKRVCVINVKQPMYFINPRIVEAEGEIIYIEACMSFPGKSVRTKRYATVTIETDNHANKMMFDASGIPPEELATNIDALECVAIQHELSHLEGKTMYDFEYKLKPCVVQPTYGRNDKIQITDGVKTQEIKFKNFTSFEKKGWVIVK